MNKKELKKESKIRKEIVELSKNDASKLLLLCKDDECYETLKKKFEELGYYYNTSILIFFSTPLNPKTPDSDFGAMIKGQIIGGTAGVIINYEKNKEQREKYLETLVKHDKYKEEYEKYWDLTVKKYYEILDILKNNKKFQLYFAKKKQKQEEEKRNRWMTKERYLFTISLVLSIIISILVSIIVYNNIKNGKNGNLGTGVNIFFSTIAFLISFFTSFVLIANASNTLFDKIKK